jgi:hypothetical protein
MPLGGVFTNTSECQMESRLDLQLLRSQEQLVVFGFAGSFQKNWSAVAEAWGIGKFVEYLEL